MLVLLSSGHLRLRTIEWQRCGCSDYLPRSSQFPGYLLAANAAVEQGRVCASSASPPPSKRAGLDAHNGQEPWLASVIGDDDVSRSAHLDHRLAIWPTVYANFAYCIRNAVRSQAFALTDSPLRSTKQLCLRRVDGTHPSKTASTPSAGQAGRNEWRVDESRFSNAVLPTAHRGRRGRTQRPRHAVVARTALVADSGLHRPRRGRPDDVIAAYAEGVRALSARAPNRWPQCSERPSGTWSATGDPTLRRRGAT